MVRYWPNRVQSTYNTVPVHFHCPFANRACHGKIPCQYQDAIIIPVPNMVRYWPNKGTIIIQYCTCSFPLSICNVKNRCDTKVYVMCDIYGHNIQVTMSSTWGQGETKRLYAISIQPSGFPLVSGAQYSFLHTADRQTVFTLALCQQW